MNIKFYKLLSLVMLGMIVGQVTVPTIYQASEVNGQLETTVASLDDFEYDSESDQYQYDFNSEEVVSFDFEYESEDVVNDYEYYLNSEQIDIDSSVDSEIGENTFEIKPTADDAGDISSLEVLTTKDESKLIEDMGSSSEVNTSDIISSEATELTNSNLAAEVPPASETIETSTRASETTELSVDDLTVNGEISIDGDRLVLNGPGIGGMALVQEKIDLTQDFNINLHYDVEGADNVAGMSLLLMPVSQIGFYSTGTNSTGGVQGNQNSVYYTIKYGSSGNALNMFDTGLHIGYVGESGSVYGGSSVDDSNDIYDRASQIITGARTNNRDMDVTVSYSASTRMLSVKTQGLTDTEPQDVFNLPTTLSIAIPESVGDEVLLGFVNAFQDAPDYDQSYYLSIDSGSFIHTTPLFSDVLEDETGDPSVVELGDSIANTFIAENYSSSYNLTIDKSTEILDGAGNQLVTPDNNIFSDEELVSTDAVTINAGVGASPIIHRSNLKGEAEFLANRNLVLPNEIVTKSLITQDYAGTSFEGTVEDELVVGKRDASITAENDTLVYNIKNIPTYNQILTDAGVVVNDGYLLTSTNEQILASDRLTNNFDTLDMTTVGDRVLTLTYKSISGDEYTLNITVSLAESDLSIDKTVEEGINDGYATAGETLTYTIAISNNASMDESNVVITDILDQNLDPSTVSAINVTNAIDGLEVDPSEYELVGNVLTITTLPANTTYNITYSINVLESNIKSSKQITEYIVNTAKATSEFMSDEIVAESSIEIGKNAAGMDELVVSKAMVSDADGDNLADVGEELTYQITLDNSASSLNQDNLVLADTPDSDETLGTITVTGVRDSIGMPLDEGTDYTVTGNQINIITPLPAGETWTVLYNVTTTDVFVDDTPLTNTVAVSGDDTAGMEVSADVSKDLAAAHNLEVTKSVVDSGSEGTATAGETLTYTITVANTGSTVEYDTVVSDDLADVNLDKSTATNLMVTTDGASDVSTVTDSDFTDGLQLTIPEILAGETVTISFDINVLTTGIKTNRIVTTTIDNTVTAANGYYDGSIADLTLAADATIELDKAAAGMDELVVTKWIYDDGDSDTYADPSEVLTFQVTLDNSASSLNQDNLVLVDTPDSDETVGEITVTEITTSTGTLVEGVDYTVTGNQIDFITSLPAGETWTVFYTVTTTDTFVDDAPYQNSIAASGDDTADVTVNSSVEKDLTSAHNLDVSKISS